MTQPMSDEQLAEIRERELSASEGPWLFKGTERQDDLSLRLTIGEAPAGEEIARIEVSAEAAGWSFHRARAQADAEFIAHARSDIPALLAEVKRLRKALHNGRAERDRLRTEPDRLAEEIRKAAAYLIRRADLGATLCPSECTALADDLYAALGGTENGR